MVAVAAPPRFICFLCKRKFQNAQLLTRHKQLSDLHQRNFQKQCQEIHTKKEELRKAIAVVRKQIQDLEVAMARKPDEELQSQRTSLELKLRQALGEYGQQQEKLEASRSLQVQERGAGTASSLTKLSEGRETCVGPLLVSVGAATWQGNKETQEDRYILDMELLSADGQKVVGFCVLDGHAGSLCVDAMTESLPRNLQQCLVAKPALTEDALRQAVTEACVLTDDEFLNMAREREVLDGSTMLVCLIFPIDEPPSKSPGRLGFGTAEEGGTRRGSKGRCKMLLANLGDSRAVLCRAQSGRLSTVRLTDDHKPGRADERKRIEGNGGVVDHQGVWRVFTPGPANFGGRSVLWGLAVSRAFGDLLMKEPQRYGCAGATGELVTAVPEIHTYDLHPAEDRFMVLACDGIWDVLGDEDAVAVCTEHRTADLAAHALIRRAFEVGSDDNLTALVVAWQPSESEAPVEAPEAKKACLD